MAMHMGPMNGEHAHVCPIWDMTCMYNINTSQTTGAQQSLLAICCGKFHH